MEKRAGFRWPMTFSIEVVGRSGLREQETQSRCEQTPMILALLSQYEKLVGSLHLIKFASSGFERWPLFCFDC